MEDIYIRDSRGLRIIAANHSLVKGQLFYLLAEGPNEDEEQNIFSKIPKLALSTLVLLLKLLMTD
jgi:hypothetical protein